MMRLLFKSSYNLKNIFEVVEQNHTQKYKVVVKEALILLTVYHIEDFKFISQINFIHKIQDTYQLLVFVHQRSSY